MFCKLFRPKNGPQIGWLTQYNARRPEVNEPEEPTRQRFASQDYQDMVYVCIHWMEGTKETLKDLVTLRIITRWISLALSATWVGNG